MRAKKLTTALAMQKSLVILMPAVSMQSRDRNLTEVGLGEKRSEGNGDNTYSEHF